MTLGFHGEGATVPGGALLLAVVCACGDPAAPEDAARVLVTPAAVMLPAGQAMTLTAEVRDVAGRRLDLAVTWRSDDSVVATVSVAGVVRGGVVGSTTVTASVGAVSGTAAVTVVPGSPASLMIERDSLTLFLTERYSLRAKVFDAGGNPVNATVTWSSPDPQVVTVDAQGVALGVGRGTARLTARADTARASLEVAVLSPLELGVPLRGELYRDFLYVNYVDQVAGEGAFHDYACGPKTVDGHGGVDLALPSFARMDSGVAVVAAADGTVADLLDGLPDRNTRTGVGGLGNFVRLEHSDRITTVYAHLARNSIVVTRGRQVGVGDTLGLVGSSGSSSHPHLHFELARGGEIIAPFGGDCGRSVDQWAVPVPYQDTLLVIGAGISDLALSADVLKLPPPPVDTLTTADSTVAMWVSLHNVRAGSGSRFDLFSPSGALFRSFQFPHFRFFSLSWWYLRYVIPDNLTEAGTWRFVYRNSDGVGAEREFVLVAVGQPGPMSGGVQTPPRPQLGGGGLTPP